LNWQKFIPPTAKVKAEVDATLDTKTGTVSAANNAMISAGALKVTYKGMSATTRGRVHAGSGYSENFEAVPLKMESPAGEKVNFPPLAWLGARIKWYILEKDESKVIANRLDNVLFQRTMNFFGDPEMSDYILSADVMTDGNRRIKSTVGLVNQRYLITLVGNQNILEVSSNHERVKSSVKFPIKANSWYSLKRTLNRTPMAPAKSAPRLGLGARKNQRSGQSRFQSNASTQRDQPASLLSHHRPKSGSSLTISNSTPPSERTASYFKLNRKHENHNRPPPFRTHHRCRSQRLANVG
jgi:hypothetical protein